MSYEEVLQSIDQLRAKGIPNSDWRMMKLRIRLRDHLEKRKKKNLPKKVIPKLTSITTYRFKKRSNLGEEHKTNKYFLLGICIAIIALIYKFFLLKN